MTVIRLSDIIDSTSALSPSQGLKAYAFVSYYLTHGEHIEVSMEGIAGLNSAFCYSFISKLFMDFDPAVVDRIYHFSGISDDDVWSKKIENARLLGTNENVRTLRKKKYGRFNLLLMPFPNIKDLAATRVVSILDFVSIALDSQSATQHDAKKSL